MSSSVIKQLKKSHAALTEYFSPSRRQEGTANPAQLVLLAEHAAKNDCKSIALESLQLYHTLDPPENQFFIRAYLCEAQILAGEPTSFSETELIKALDLLIKAVSIASKYPCYHFLVYNASVLMWEIYRPFHCPGMRKYFAKPLQTMIKTLDGCKLQDYPWKLELLTGLILSQVDAGHKDEASKSSLLAIQLARKYSPAKLGDIIRIHASYDLGDSKPYEKEAKKFPELNFIFKMNKIKHSITHQGLCGPELEQKLLKLFKSICGTQKSSGRDSSPNLEKARPLLLLELAFLAAENSLHALAWDCLLAVPKHVVKNDPVLFLRRDILSSLLLAVGSSDGEQYTKPAVDARLEGLLQLEETLISAKRIGDPEIIQHVCVVMWNLSLPLLQPNLCHLLQKPLNAMVNALGEIKSLLYEMRACAHLELAKISAQLNELEAALQHLSKATTLDINDKYSESLKDYALKFTLRAKVYQTPESNLNKATKILEQCQSLMNEEGKASDDGLGPMLIKAGNLIAPKFFTFALGGSLLTAQDSSFPIPSASPPHNDLLPPSNASPLPSSNVLPTSPEPLAEASLLHTNPDVPEDQITAQSSTMEPGLMDPSVLDALSRKGEKLQHYKAISNCAQGHVLEYGNSDATRRCLMLGEMAKMARKKKIWDVANIAAVFCIQYCTSGKCNVPSALRTSQSKVPIPEQSSQNLSEWSCSGSSKRRRTSTANRSPRISTATPSEPPLRKEEKTTVRMLAEVHCLLAECFVHQLQDEGLRLGEKPQPSIVGADSSLLESNNEDWVAYMSWCSTLTSTAYQCFLTAAELGVFLQEQHLVSNAAIYLWNYNHHLIQSKKLIELIPTYRSLLAIMRKLTSLNDGETMTHICTVFAGGVAMKWVPVPHSSSKQTTPTPRKGGSKKAEPSRKKGASSGLDLLHVDPEGIPELKEAVGACDFALGINEGVALEIRRELLVSWVQCKQLLRDPIPPKVLGIHEMNDGSTLNCRTIVAMEMIAQQGNKLWEFPNTPSPQEVFSMLSECTWTNSLLEMELWTTLAQLGLKHKNHEMVYQCAAKAMNIITQQDRETPPAIVAQNDFSESQVLSHACFFQGQSLAAMSDPTNVGMIRRALAAFLDSARFGYNAKSFQLVIAACSQYWNSSLHLSRDPLERDLLREPLFEILDLAAALIPQKWKDERLKTPSDEKDMNLLFSMYSVLFQSYIDQEAWEDGLKAVEEAMWMMPKSMQRNLARYKLIFKSRLSRSIESDMIWFQDEPEHVVASLWYKAAIHTIDPAEKLQAYQNTIGALQSGLHPWLKINYLIELSEWLYEEQYPIQDVFNQLRLALNILLTMSDHHQPTKLESADERLESGDEGTPAPNGVTKATTNPALTLSSTSNMIHLELLLRVHVMMAQLHGEGSQSHWDFSMAALAYCSLMWKLLYKFYSEREDAPKSATDEHAPNSPKEWAKFKLPDQMINFMSASKETNTINKKSIHKPMLTLYYLDILVESLLSLSLHPLALPVLHLELAIALTTLTHPASLCKLLHMRLAKICLEMGLSSEATHHQEKVGTAILIPDDLVRLTIEMELSSAKKKAIAREESRRQLLATRSSKNVSKNTRSSCQSVSQSPQSKAQDPYSVEDELVVREIWVKQARLLIQQGQYYSARELLSHAEVASQHFDDAHTLLQVHINYGLLAVAEKNIHVAISSLSRALKMPCHLDSLLDGVLILSEAMLTESNYREQHTDILRHMVKLVEATGQQSRVAQKTIHLLKFRMAQSSLSELLDHMAKPFAHAYQIKAEALQYCSTMADLCDLLLELGHHRETSKLSIQLSDLCIRLGERVDGSEHKEYLLWALSTYQKALNALLSCHSKAISICQYLQDIVLPVEIEIAGVQLKIAEVLLTIFAVSSKEERSSRTTQQQKSSIKKMVDNYIKDSNPVLPEVEQKWTSTVALACDKSLNLLGSAHSMAKNDPSLRAKCTYLLGHCFNVLSEHTNPDPPQQWDSSPLIHSISENKNIDESEKVDAQETEVQDLANKYSTLSMVVRKQEADVSELEESFSLICQTQAIHSFTEAISIAVSNKEWGIAIRAALDLVDRVGRFDPAISSLYLAFYQSLVFSMEMAQFLRKLQWDPATSQLGALLHQRDRILHEKSQAVKTNTVLLNTFEVYQKLSVNTNHLDIIRSYPSNFRFIILQHSPDKSELYSAYIFPPQPSPQSSAKRHSSKKRGSAKQKQSAMPPGKATMDPSPPPVKVPVICSTKMSPEKLSSLEHLMAKYREQAHQCQSNANISQHDKVESLFREVCTAMTAYLSEALQPVDAALKKESIGNSDLGLYVVILADSTLLSLPLEMLPLLQQENISSVSRDFSLQMLHHRLMKSISEDGVPSDAKKKDKHVHETVLANTTGFKYVLDPTNCVGSDSCSHILSIFQAFNKLTAKWIGFSPKNNTMDLSRWPMLLQNCAGMIFFGTERVLAHVQARTIAALNLGECSFGLFMDSMTNLQSSLLQSRLDFHKSETDLYFEEPVQTAMLFSLTGLGCMVTNQWYGPINRNLELTTSILKSLLSESVTVGKVHWLTKRVQKNAGDDSTPSDENLNSTIYNSVVYGIPHLILIQ